MDKGRTVRSNNKKPQASKIRHLFIPLTIPLTIISELNVKAILDCTSKSSQVNSDNVDRL